MPGRFFFLRTSAIAASMTSLATNCGCQSFYGIQSIAFAQPGALDGFPQNVNRLIVGLPVNRVRVAVFAAVRKGIASRIAERSPGAVNNFGK